MQSDLFPLPVTPPLDKENFSQQVFNDFFSFPIHQAEQALQSSTAEAQEQSGQKMALHIFHEAAERVPAYQKFLKEADVRHQDIVAIDDFSKVPPIDKENYLKKHSLADLSWDGDLHNSHMISVSSGSTGNPFFWPRGILSEMETTYVFEHILSSLFKTQERSTLFINAFAMGMYVGGPLTLNAILRLAQKGHKIIMVTPGYSLEEILRITKELAPMFEQVILASYPPFAKDIIDEGTSRKIKWPTMNMKFLLAGEGYSEEWRDYIAELTGSNPENDFVNIYGTADAAMLGHEMPISTALRRTFNQSRESRQAIFGDERLPSFLQYYPSLKYFEVTDNQELLFTASAGIPLIRYNIKDRGGIVPYQEGLKKAQALGFDIAKWTAYQTTVSTPLPFVYVFGRSDFTVTFYGANIYPENIKLALESKKIREKLSGKFTMQTENDDQQNQQLIINIECHPDAKPSRWLTRTVEKTVIDRMRELNLEYGVVYKSRGKKARPVIRLYPHGDEEYFKQGIKQRWTIR